MADTRMRGNVSEKSIDSHGKDVLEKIFKSKELLLDTQVVSQLKKTLSDAKVVDAVFDYYKKRLETIKAKVNKFKIALLKKYAMSDLSTRQLLEKAKKYTKKYELSDGEFSMFMNLLFTDRTTPYHSMFNIPSSPMSRTLGYSIDASMGDKMVIGEGDMEHLKVILEKERETKALHSQLILQTLTYTDLAPDAMLGQFDQTRHNAYNYIHPIIAALFLPKIVFLEERMVLANLANIIKSKNEGKPLMTQPEYAFYWDLITDPNQSVCIGDNTKTMIDLKNRVMLQTKLWNSIMNLRLGKYYVDDMAGFMATIEACNSSIFDAPDLLYAHDEGTILRRLLNAFSIRPTVVQISSMAMQSGITSMALAPANYTQITTVPMINLRLPRAIGNIVAPASINLRDALDQPDWFIDGKTPVMKSRTVVHSGNILFFYVDRRYRAYNFVDVQRPHMFTGLPPTMINMDSVNDMNVEFDWTFPLREDTYNLRSVVFVETSKLSAMTPKVITGCSAGIIRPQSAEVPEDLFYRYDPLGAAHTHVLANGDQVNYAPVHDIPRVAPNDEVAFVNLAEKRGVIFMYTKMAI